MIRRPARLVEPVEFKKPRIIVVYSGAAHLVRWMIDSSSEQLAAAERV
jgi:hypothetical protein